MVVVRYLIIMMYKKQKYIAYPHLSAVLNAQNVLSNLLWINRPNQLSNPFDLLLFNLLHEHVLVDVKHLSLL